MLKDWYELANERGPMADPSSGIRKFDMPAGPVRLLLGSLNVSGDQADYDYYDARAQRAKSLAET